MKHLSLLILLTVVIIFSCKKKDNTSTTTSTVVGTTGTTGGAPSSTVATFNGLCSNQKIYNIFGGTTYTSSYAQNFAVFSSSAFNNFDLPSILESVGTLSLNNVIFNSNFNYYSDAGNQSKTSPFVWSCSGAGTVQAFTYTNTNNYASYADYVYWPDTLKKSQGLSLTFTGLQQASEAEVIITNYGNNPTPLTFSVVTSAGGLSITPAQLSSISSSTPAILQCNFFKNNIQLQGGKAVNFRVVTTFVKNLPVRD